uniref:Pentatricopeptide repeat-containing protein n=1 Tax=Kalanchoe fedtschenkoi TaxID=63787 RepID=A0A7N0RH14_KALFE
MAASALPTPISSPPPPPRRQPSPLPTSIPAQAQPRSKKPPSIRARLAQLCQDGRPLDARQLFDEIPDPTTVLWNTVVIGFVCNEMEEEAVEMYARMKGCASAKFDAYTYSSVLKACAELGDLRVGKAVHCHVVRCQVMPSRVVDNSLLNMYSSCLGSGSGEMECMEFDGVKCDLVYRVFGSMKKRNVVAVNTMVAWYVKTRRFGEAVRLFRNMMSTGIKVTPVSFVNVFPAILSLGSVNMARLYYGLVLKLGSEYVVDKFVVSSAMVMFSELGYLDLARRIFDQSVERDTEVWNTMIAAYVQSNRPGDAIQIFLEAFESGWTVLDEVTFLSVLTAASQLQELELAEQLHTLVVKNSMVSEVMIVNTLIVMYSRCGSVETSFEFFNSMTERDTVSWNTMVSALVQNGFDNEGVMLVHGMQKEGFSVDSITATALLSASSNLKDPDLGRQTHGYLIRHGIKFEGMESYLIDMYMKSGLIDIARRLFESSNSEEIDQATWNSMICGYTQSGLYEEGFTVFREMLLIGVMPTPVTLASILPTCSPMGSIALGKQVHGFAVRQFMDGNVFVGSALIDMYSKLGAITYAESVFGEASEKNPITFTNMILGYGHHGMGEKALSLFFSMQGSGFQPDAITLVAILSACSYSGLVDEGLKIYQSMERDYGIRPSSEHFCCVADMLGRAGRIADAYEFITNLGEEGNLVGTWGSLLAACKIHREFELGKLVSQKLIEMENQNRNAGYHVLLSNMYADEGEWNNVVQLRKGMQERGLRKDAGCSWIEIAGSVNSFVSKDHNHSQADRIYNMLQDLATEMRDPSYKPPPISRRSGSSELDE